MTKVKHGGYSVSHNGIVIARIPSNGHGAGHWIKSARKAIEAA